MKVNPVFVEYRDGSWVKVVPAASSEAAGTEKRAEEGGDKLLKSGSDVNGRQGEYAK